MTYGVDEHKNLVGFGFHFVNLIGTGIDEYSITELPVFLIIFSASTIKVTNNSGIRVGVGYVFDRLASSNDTVQTSCDILEDGEDLAFNGTLYGGLKMTAIIAPAL